MTEIAISVVIPTYQRAHRLPELLKALCAQELDAAYEVIIVDNGCTDDTSRLLASVEDARIVPLRIDVNRGPVPARNAGWQQARAEIIAFTDDDCIPDRHWLRGLLDGFTEAEVVQGRTEPNPAHRHRLGPFSHTRRVVHEDGFYATSNMAFRREVLEATGGFDEHFYFGGEDTDLGWRAKALGFRVRFCAEAVVYHDITRSDFPGTLRIQRQWCGMVRVVDRHPELRKVFPPGILWRPLQKSALLALCSLGLLLPAALSANWWALGLGLSGGLPYAYARLIARPQEGSRARRIAVLPLSLMVDLLGLYWHLRTQLALQFGPRPKLASRRDAG